MLQTEVYWLHQVNTLRLLSRTPLRLIKLTEAHWTSKFDTPTHTHPFYYHRHSTEEYSLTVATHRFKRYLGSCCYSVNKSTSESITGAERSTQPFWTVLRMIGTLPEFHNGGTLHFGDVFRIEQVQAAEAVICPGNLHDRFCPLKRRHFCFGLDSQFQPLNDTFLWLTLWYWAHIHLHEKKSTDRRAFSTYAYNQNQQISCQTDFKPWKSVQIWWSYRIQ